MKIPLSIFLGLALATAASAQNPPTVTVIASFPRYSTHSIRAPHQLIQAAGGIFYGVASPDTIFLMTPEGGLKTLFSFGPHPSGWLPRGPLTEGRGGHLYGTTFEGGSAYGGIVFKISLDGALETLHTFCQHLVGSTGYCPDGANSLGGLIRGLDGWFYGTNYNVAYRIGPHGTFVVLHTFNKEPASGAGDGIPAGPLVQASDGNFYGLTNAGGDHGQGSLYRLTPQGQVELLYSFTDTVSDLTFPTALIQASDGDLYGVTKYGGLTGDGTVFRISLQGAYQKILDIAAIGGAFPDTAPIQASDGNLWGVAGSIVYAITTSGSVVQIVDLRSKGLQGTDGLILGSDGKLYGPCADLNTMRGCIYIIDAGLAPPIPSIAGFSPASAPVGTEVVISGAYFVGTTGVSFNGVSAGFVVNASGVVTATVPAGALTGSIQVTTPGGAATSSSSFAVTP